MRHLLVDNGSLRPDSILNLRRVARELSAAAGIEVTPASLLHSSKVPPHLLQGEPAVNLERRIRLCLAAGERRFCILPFFFGPTGALTEYLPRRLAALHARFGDFHVERAPFLYDDAPGADNSILLDILTDLVRQTIARLHLLRPPAILVDHGSPLPQVTAVRDALAAQLALRLQAEVAALAPASMERRPGPAYAFNEPLLADLLARPPFHSGPVVVALLFLSPGRHAGPHGDIARICAAAQAANPSLRPVLTPLVGTHPGILPLLRQRLKGVRSII